jgi:hypothetical protein
MQLKCVDLAGKPYRSLKVEHLGYEYQVTAYNHEDHTSITMSFNRDQIMDFLIMLTQTMPLSDTFTAKEDGEEEDMEL